MTKNKELLDKGFTNAGVERLNLTVSSYEQKLIDLSIAIGEAKKDRELSIEITNDHVRAAASNLMSPVPKTSKFEIAAGVGERFCSAGFAYGLAMFSTNWGVWIALFSFVMGAALLMFRTLSSKR